MAIRLPDPQMQLGNNNMDPLTGGFMYTYEAGTTTPLATYQDADENAFNTNPVILNSAGRANVFWKTNQLYRVVVTDALGTQLYEVDDFGAAQGSSSGGFAGGFGAETSIASATTVDLGTVTSHFALITGATTVSSFGTKATTDFPIYLVRIQSNGLVINLGANIICPFFTGSSITTTQNDYLCLHYLGSGIWKIYSYLRGDGSVDATTVRCTTLIETGT